HLQKLIVGAALHLDQVRHLGDLGNPPETLAHALTAGEGLSHWSSSIPSLRRSDAVQKRPLAADLPGRPPLDVYVSGLLTARDGTTYLISTFAPASSSCFLILAASSLDTP